MQIKIMFSVFEFVKTLLLFSKDNLFFFFFLFFGEASNSEGSNLKLTYLHF